ncbi:Rieske 2Fe-2S domain-containing protein [Sphingomonas bacterium]|uniref:Rieske (2Fe-2S) protein n=1 Tax=Sphingomonas bacterium TaxID=1895847 RepID=UPI002634E8B8|nr:Rieske 2Fe-2S domain-containing protein [Sphingomonas bacterium]MDB5677924.1 Rieske (2Fe-2S) domain protein [Sphingomonas bacterium]
MTIERLQQTPAGVVLGPLDAISPGGARNYVVAVGSGRFHGFVVRMPAGIRGFVDRCPHLGALLALELDRYLTNDGRFVICGWHGALFEPDTGLCVAGPCDGSSLIPWPVHVADGQIVTGRRADPRSQPIHRQENHQCLR